MYIPKKHRLSTLEVGDRFTTTWIEDMTDVSNYVLKGRSTLWKSLCVALNTTTMQEVLIPAKNFVYGTI